MTQLGKFRGWAILAFVFPAISFFNISAHASPALNAPIQVTSNPGEDFAPTVSADGKVMVYVSDKSGKPERFVKEVQTGFIISGLEINADIVTLSACQTGLGDIVGGDEIVGLNRAFIYAGTKSILSSLWRVSDISTAVLIKHFYRNYGHGNKAESLRKAQLLVRRLYPHPSYWAGFNLTGDYR